MTQKILPKLTMKTCEFNIHRAIITEDNTFDT